ncbi:TPA: helix-turn-helix domain-containing protein [Streptococcus suis]
MTKKTRRATDKLGSVGGPMTVAEKIKYILQVTGWSQQAVADELGISQHAVSAWKRGRPPQEKFIDKINQLHDQARRMDWERKRANEAVPDESQVLSKRGKIILKYPYYSHQRMPWEK